MQNKSSPPAEFSFRTRKEAISRFKSEQFDVLVIGGGITGAAVARDATFRGLKVALVEKADFANGTSSRSSKLIHGGLRYLENLEFGLVFEALSERALLLKTAPHMVRPLPFYWPVYQGDLHGKTILSLGMIFYDLLALFRAPGFHKRLSKRGILSDIPFLRQEGLKGGFRYFDASMWDDVLVIETLRSASNKGAAIANYVEALSPVWRGDRIAGFKVRNLELCTSDEEIEINAHQVIVCGGPWTDRLGESLSKDWKPWLKPSTGVHLIFDLKRIPIPGAMVMNHPHDGRISFVIPRPDFGTGVVIVGTTDAPASDDPALVSVEKSDVEYLMALLTRYFPTLELTEKDILSAYVGVRPLMNQGDADTEKLQKVSREHHIDLGPGGTTVVAGGKYTTHRKMAEEIVDFTLKNWKKSFQSGKHPSFPKSLQKQDTTQTPVNDKVSFQAIENAKITAKQKGLQVYQELLSRYGSQAIEIEEAQLKNPSKTNDPEGFPCLTAQLRHSIQNEMVLHLDDFYLRRTALYAARADHGLPWLDELGEVWSEELKKTPEQKNLEKARLQTELQRRSAWSNQNI